MKIGIELEAEGARHIELTDELEADWSCTEDSSLRDGGVEYVSHVFNNPDEGFKSYFKLKDFVQAEGGQYNKRCGLHVHVSMEKRFTQGTLSKFLFKYLLMENLLFELGDSSRHHSNFCYPILQDSNSLSIFSEICNQRRSVRGLRIFPRSSKYTALNLQTISTIGTLEFRMLSPMTSDENLSQQFTIIKDIFKLSAIALKKKYKIPEVEYFKLVSLLLRRDAKDNSALYSSVGLLPSGRIQPLTLLQDRVNNQDEQDPEQQEDTYKSPFEIFFGE